MSETDRANEAMKDLSRALDEIYTLRRQMAYEAVIVEAQVLSLTSLSRGRKKVMQERVRMMRLAAQGKSDVALAGEAHVSLDAACDAAGIDTTLTRHSWRKEIDERMATYSATREGGTSD